MTERSIYITTFDHRRLTELLDRTGDVSFRDRADLQLLQNELTRAHIVAPKEVPPTVVTMNSKVRLRDLDGNEEMTYTLVFPNEANVETGRISIMSPIGTAMLGYSVGDEIQWKVPAGMRHIRIEEILYQPEASGHFDL